MTDPTQPEPTPEHWRCSKCKGRNIQRACWVNPNTKEVLEDFGDHDEHHHGKTWCADCEEHTELQLYDPIPHAIDCDMGVDCTCGAEQADKVVAYLQDAEDGVTVVGKPFRYEVKVEAHVLARMDNLAAMQVGLVGKAGPTARPVRVTTLEEWRAIFGEDNRPGEDDGKA